MVRLHIIVEGQTEQVFVATLLIPHLAAKGVYLYTPQLAAHGRKQGKTHRGGVLGYLPFKNDLCRRLKNDQSADVRFTTMIDLYGLPHDFPGSSDTAKATDPYARVAKLEAAFRDDIDDPRFIPYIQLHEFEALLLADPRKFEVRYHEHERQIQSLEELCQQYDTPEKIDDGEQSAPSKRISNEIADYLGDKPTAGPIIAAEIGLPTMREKCPHFNNWLTKLEKLGETHCASGT